MLDTQGTYQYWGAKLFSYLRASAAQDYSFQMQVDSAARLWVNNTLIINATCRKHWKSMCSATLHQTPKNASNPCCCYHQNLSTPCSCSLPARPPQSGLLHVTQPFMLQVVKTVPNPPQTVLFCGVASSTFQLGTSISQLSTTMAMEVVHLFCKVDTSAQAFRSVYAGMLLMHSDLLLR